MGQFAFYCYVRDLPKIVENMTLAEANLRRNRRPVAASMLLRAYGNLREELLGVGKLVADFGTEELRRQEQGTRVRPDHVAVGFSLADGLKCEVIEPGLMPGSVGVADQQFLDSHVPWWITNEVGSHGRVGGHIFGFFYGAGDEEPPDPSQFRDHPLFQVGSASDPVSGPGVISNPIPARRFIEKSIPAIDRKWRAGVTVVRARFEERLLQVSRTMT